MAPARFTMLKIEIWLIIQRMEDNFSAKKLIGAFSEPMRGKSSGAS
jgi:hypothetical protein